MSAFGYAAERHLYICRESGRFGTEKEIAKKMKESNLISYVFTSDNKEEVKKIFDMGANIVGTNFLE